MTDLPVDDVYSVSDSVSVVEEAPVVQAEADVGDIVDVPTVDDVIPGLIGDVLDAVVGISEGMENLGTINQNVETIIQVLDHPALTTPFENYSVMEGLLLLLLVFGVVKACVNMIKGAFSWLL